MQMKLCVWCACGAGSNLVLLQLLGWGREWGQLWYHIKKLGLCTTKTGEDSRFKKVTRSDFQAPILCSCGVLLGVGATKIRRHYRSMIWGAHFCTAHPPLFFWSTLLSYSTLDLLSLDPHPAHRSSPFSAGWAFGGQSLSFRTEIQHAE